MKSTFCARKESTQTSSTDIFKITWDVEDFDTNNFFDLDSDQFKPKIPGYYQLSFAIQAQSPSIALDILLWKNGQEIATWNDRRYSPDGVTYPTVSGSIIVYANDTDSFELRDYFAISNLKKIGIGGKSANYWCGTLVE